VWQTCVWCVFSKKSEFASGGNLRAREDLPPQIPPRFSELRSTWCQRLLLYLFFLICHGRIWIRVRNLLPQARGSYDWISYTDLLCDVIDARRTSVSSTPSILLSIIIKFYSFFIILLGVLHCILFFYVEAFTWRHKLLVFDVVVSFVLLPPKRSHVCESVAEGSIIWSSEDDPKRIIHCQEKILFSVPFRYVFPLMNWEVLFDCTCNENLPERLVSLPIICSVTPSCRFMASSKHLMFN
jgi:hypothetical protein